MKDQKLWHILNWISRTKEHLHWFKAKQLGSLTFVLFSQYRPTGPIWSSTRNVPVYTYIWEDLTWSWLYHQMTILGIVQPHLKSFSISYTDRPRMGAVWLVDWCTRQLELFQIAPVNGPRIGGVWLVNFWTDNEAIKTRSHSTLNLVLIWLNIGAIICNDQEI